MRPRGCDRGSRRRPRRPSTGAGRVRMGKRYLSLDGDRRHATRGRDEHAWPARRIGLAVTALLAVVIGGTVVLVVGLHDHNLCTAAAAATGAPLLASTAG